FFGVGFLIQVLLATAAAWATEGAILRLRKTPVVPTLSDNSALLTSLLLGISLPPLAPWWLVVLGTIFAIVIAKQLYGGLGQNPFNPA
ncbi:RnfABCDGE type electron transport complex subunit D, partial [Klebsiella pneumoniae]|nr:RnfABCDGE type electron transport complex subunit D [Klebsiella pneumoniae]